MAGSTDTPQTTPISRQRAKVLKRMPPALREVVSTFDVRFGKNALAFIQQRYDLGARLIEIMADEGTYGANAEQDLADYFFKGSAETCRTLRLVAETFTREWVTAKANQQTSGGNTLEMFHFVLLARVEDPALREKFLQRVYQDDMSTKELALYIKAGHKSKHVRGGGRNPTVSDSPIVFLTKFGSIGNSLARYAAGIGPDKWKALEEVDSDSVNEGYLDRLIKAREVTGKAAAVAQAATEHIDRAIEHAKEVLGAVVLAGEGEAAEGEAQEEAPRKAKKKKVKAGKSKEKKGDALVRKAGVAAAGAAKVKKKVKKAKPEPVEV